MNEHESLLSLLYDAIKAGNDRGASVIADIILDRVFPGRWKAKP